MRARAQRHKRWQRTARAKEANERELSPNRFCTLLVHEICFETFCLCIRDLCMYNWYRFWLHSLVLKFLIHFSTVALYSVRWMFLKRTNEKKNTKTTRKLIGIFTVSILLLLLYVVDVLVSFWYFFSFCIYFIWICELSWAKSGSEWFCYCQCLRRESKFNASRG